MRNIILASKSPRRCELMTQAGYEFTIQPSDMEEIITKILPMDVVMELSGQKAKDVFDIISKAGNVSADEEILVIGADTVVSVDDKILGKPKNHDDAFGMLKVLQGRTHEVYTGVTLVWNKDGQVNSKSFHECTKVCFYPMSDEEIWKYVDSCDGDDKAGSYGIQGPCAIYIKGIEGDYNNVVGLPIARLYQEMKEIE